MRNKIIILGVVIAVIVFASFIFVGQNNKSAIDTNNQDDKIVDPVTPVDENKDQPQGNKPTLPSGLNSDEKAAFNASISGSNVDSEQQIVLANKASKEVGTINVTGCNMNPAILKVKFGNTVTLKNDGEDEAAVTLYVDNVTRLVKAGGTTTFTANFAESGSGLFGYYCRSNQTVSQGLVLMYND